MSTASSINEPEQPFPVLSRISWGAILGGTAVTFSVYVLLSLLGAAVGLSVNPANEALAVGAAIWAIAAFMVAIFIGGWVASRFTLGEDTVEAILYGAILWGVSFVLILGLFGLGFGTLVGMSAYPVAGISMSEAQIETLGTEAGLNADQIGRLQTAARQRVPDEGAFTQTAWWAFGGTLLTMIAAISGTSAGASPFGRRLLMGERFVVYTRRPAAGAR